MSLLAQTTTYDNSGAGAGAAAAIAAAAGSIFVFALIAIVISIAIYYVIFNRAGFNPWLSLLVLIPGLGQLIVLIILIFTEWPVQREVKVLRAQLGLSPTGPAGTPGTAYGAPGATYGTTAPPGTTYPNPPPNTQIPPPGTPPAV